MAETQVKMERAAFEIVAEACAQAWEQGGDVCKTIMAAIASPETRAALYAQANDLGRDDAGIWTFERGEVTNGEDDLIAKCADLKTGRYLASVSPQVVGSLLADYNRQADEIASLTRLLKDASRQLSVTTEALCEATDEVGHG